MARIEIVSVEISDDVRAKLGSKHGLEEDDVWNALETRSKAGFSDHPDYGRRLLVRGSALNGDTLRIVLYPIAGSPGAWRLGTAFRE